MYGIDVHACAGTSRVVSAALQPEMTRQALCAKRVGSQKKMFLADTMFVYLLLDSVIPSGDLATGKRGDRLRANIGGDSSAVKTTVRTRLLTRFR